jgi:4-hydroxy-4-methyl-2-oxoglutarate aldolase
VCGGATVEAGDVVLGDRDGVVVIPQGRVGEIVGTLDEIRRMEEETQAKIRAGMGHLPAIEALLQSDRVAYVD